MEHEGASLGALEVALATRNCGGVVIAQVKRIVPRGSIHPQRVAVPSTMVDYVVVDPDQVQATQTVYDPALSGEERKPREAFAPVPFGPDKVIARRAALELARGDAVNLGFGISPLVPLILLEEGCDDAVTWAIEQGPVGGIPPRLRLRLRVQRPGDHSFAGAVHLFPGRRVRPVHAVVPRDRSRGVGQRVAPLGPAARHGGLRRLHRHHRAREAHRVFRLLPCRRPARRGGRQLRILKEGKVAKLVPEVEHVTFSGRRARAQGQRVTIVTERCVLKLESRGSWSPRSHPVWILSAMSCRRPRFRFGREGSEDDGSSPLSRAAHGPSSGARAA